MNFNWDAIDFYWKCILLLWLWQKSNWFAWCLQGICSRDASSLMIKVFQTQSWQSVPPSKILNVKTLYDPGDLENLIPNNKKVFALCILGEISSLYHKQLLIYGHLPILFIEWEIQLWPINSRHEGTVILFWIYLVVFTWGVHISDMEPPGQVVSNL